MSFGKKLIKNSLFGVLEFAWPIFLSIAITPFIIRKLGTDLYGILSIVAITLGFFGILDLGLGQAAVRDIAEHYEKKDYKEINRVISSILLSNLFLGVFGALIIFFSTDLLVNLLKIPNSYKEVSKFAFYMAAIGFFINMLVAIFGAIPKAAQRYDVSTKLSIIFGTITSIATVLILYLGYGLKELIIFNFIFGLIVGFIYFLVAKKVIPEIRVSFKFHKDIFFKLFKFGSFFLITSISGIVLMQLDKLLIGSLIAVSAVTFYIVPSNITQRIQGLITSAVNILLPVTSALSGTGQNEKMQKVYKSVMNTVLLIATTISIPVFVFSGKFLNFWLGPDFANQSTIVMMFLVPTYLFLGITSVPWAISLGVGKSKINAFFSVLVACLNVIFIYLFYKPFGLNGIAAAYFLSVYVSNPIAIFYIERKILNLSGYEFWLIYYKILILGIIQGLLSFMLLPFASSFILTLLLMASCMLILPALYFILKMMTPDETNLINNFLNKFKGKQNDSSL